jgi:cytochrome o ubiquinol oxidase operon protein cyoD
LTAPHANAPAHGGKGALWMGSVLSILLTAVPFWLVMTGVLHSAAATALTIFALAIVQIVVHVACFLHVNPRSEGGWTLLAFLFTAIIVMITIIGSIWVMYHLNTNMMPMSAQTMGPMR